MLIRYKKILEKIAMGLLSFMPDEKDIKKLQATIKQYETLENWQLYLWKEEDDMIGLIGVVIESEETVLIQHLTVNPSFRNQGIGRKMLQQMKEIYCNKEFKANDVTASYVGKCGTEV
ncbi:GNAT family N-acetyltransferase [Bacillus massiliigorillae]|uniref:GNAT family N-acetyltransferase n=1 Tax=Bacillus massiliigorillae TaxID=1243664 RepID=UPI00039F7492|nr:GNAT family N-acetyltransferase [Bacillus massiliigorillae]